MNATAETVYHATVPTPIGELLLTSDGERLCGVSTVAEPPSPGRGGRVSGPGVLAQAAAELRAYFAGELRAFTVPVRLGGTPFQRRVWAELCRIPYGETISYAELAARVGNANAARAVGAANGRNRLCVVVPCHRVVAADGTLGGYGGGLAMKAWLLNHEAGAEKWAVPSGVDTRSAVGRVCQQMGV